MLTHKLFIDNLKKIAPDYESAKFLIAVSGGKDSTLMSFLFYKQNLKFDMAHCNFHLRDTESDSDMAFVISLSIEYECGLLIKEFFHDDFEKYKGKSVEMIARELRYNWFFSLQDNYDYVVIAHQANDNAETIFLNLMRGTGLKGLTAINSKNNKIIRPLLSFSSEDINLFIKENNIKYRTDSSNFSNKYIRNRIRNNIFPEIQKINPSFIKTMNRNIDILNKQYEYYYSNIEKEVKKITNIDKNSITIEIDKILNTDFANLIFYETLAKYNFNSDIIDNIFSSLSKQSGKKFFSPTHALLKDRKKIIIMERSEPEKNITIIKSVISAAKYGFEIEKINSLYIKNENTIDNNCIYVDPDFFSFPLVLRNWNNGDKFYPFGMRGSKKVSDFFTDIKLNIFNKQKVPILCCGDKIMWVVGYRADNRFKIKKNSKSYIKITYHE